MRWFIRSFVRAYVHHKLYTKNLRMFNLTVVCMYTLTGECMCTLPGECMGLCRECVRLYREGVWICKECIGGCVQGCGTEGIIK